MWMSMRGHKGPWERCKKERHEHMRGFGRHRHEHGGEMRRGRVFDHGDLRLLILHMIAEKPRHGYEIIKAIDEKLGGAYSPSPGAVYPTLTMLEELGHASVQPSEGSKKLYTITPEGQAFLDANKAAVDGLLQRMDEINAATRRAGPAPQILRAKENLSLALRMRLTRGELSEEAVRAIVSALDAAAIAVERS